MDIDILAVDIHKVTIAEDGLWKVFKDHSLH